MPRPPIDLGRKIKYILQHSQPLPDEVRAPILHYRRTSTDIWNTLAYIERAFEAGDRYQAVADRHLGRLYGMALVNLIETFERFLKEIAAECVDCLAIYVVDDRFNAFKIQGANLAAHFGSRSMGRALCESSTWLDCREINQRFRELLADPFQVGGAAFHLFPAQHQLQPGQKYWLETMNLVWQLRHTSVHNVGVITQSDAVKLRLLAKEAVASPRILTPTRVDLVHLKRFLDEVATECNVRVGGRLAALLTTLHGSTAGLFQPQETADAITSVFQIPLQVAGSLGVLPA